MMKFVHLRHRASLFLRDCNGATAIEYGMIAAGIFVAIIAIIYQLGGTVAADYQSVADSW